jgi:hypothetical protein
MSSPQTQAPQHIDFPNEAKKGPTLVINKPLVTKPMQKCDDQNCIDLVGKIA